MELAEDIVKAAAEAVEREFARDLAGVGGGWGAQGRTAAVAVLRVLVGKHFPQDDEDVDYHYACEGLAQDAIDALQALEDSRG